MIKRFIIKALNRMGYDLTPRGRRSSLEGVLQSAGQNGLSPATIIDAGAGRGDFARSAMRHFPDAACVMIEPLEEFQGQLAQTCRDFPKSRIVQAVASAQPGQAMLHVHPDLFGSSLFLEREESDVNGQPRQVEAVTLEGLAAHLPLSPPYLMKVDVQGAELDVLRGAQAILPQTELVILECSFFNFFDRGPLFHEIVAYMSQNGFLLYDLFGLAYRPLDGALAQVDAVFARQDGPLRRHSHYATAQQRQDLTKRLRA